MNYLEIRAPIDSCILLRKNIKILLVANHWTVKQLALKTDISYETLKKIINGTITNPTVQNLVKIANAFHCSIDYLLSPQIHAQTKFQNLPPHSQALIHYMINFVQMQKSINSQHSSKFIPLYTPSYDSYHDFQHNFFQLDTLDIGHYKLRYSNEIDFALRITTNHYHPVFFEHDILLLGCDRPPNYAEVGLFIYKHRLYLRQYFPGKQIRLEPVNNIGTPITLASFHNWNILGYVITRYQPFDLDS